MSEPERFRLLAVDDDVTILDSFRAVFAARMPSPAALRLNNLESELFGAVAADEPDMLFELDTAEGGAAAQTAVRAALQQARPYSVIFLDARMPPGPDGLETAQAIRAADPLVTIVVVTAFMDVDPSEFAGREPPEEQLFYLAKPFQPAEIRQLARSLSRRWRMDSATRGEAPDDGAVKARLGTLSRRERDVFERVVKGMANKEIAQALQLSPRTVENYRAKVMGKMRADTLPDLVRMAVQAGRA